jgi:hypothetical protein
MNEEQKIGIRTIQKPIVSFREFAEERNGVWPAYPSENTTGVIERTLETVADYMDYVTTKEVG